MKKTYGLLVVATLFFFVIITLWGWGHSYASQSTIPQHVQLSSWNIGTLPIDDFRRELEEKLEQLEQTPLKFTFGSSGIKPIKTTLADLGVTYNVRQLLLTLDEMQEGPLWKRMMTRYHFPTLWKLQFQWENDPWPKQLTPDWEERTFGRFVNAERKIMSDEQIRYTPEKNVLRIDRVQFEQRIRAAIPHDWHKGKTITIEVPLQKTAPPVTLAALQEEGIERKIIEFSTKFGPKNHGRMHNINAVAQTIHNQVLQPDEVFDYGKIVAKAEEKFGFEEAPVILNGELVPGIGGGICQVSSTLYNAVLLTGLEVVERRNHSLPVAYLQKGLDATFSQGGINFRFKNTTGKHLLIRTAVKNNRLIIQFFGTTDKKVSYKMGTKILKVLEPSIKYVQNSKLPIGQRETIQHGKRGYKVEVYRKKFINGREIERQRISVDTYKPRSTLIAVNTGKSEQSPPRKEQDPVVEDGVKRPLKGLVL